MGRGGIDDTDPEARRVQVEILRQKSPAEKLAMVGSACASTRALVLAGLRRDFPGAGPDELHLRLMERYLGAGHPAIAAWRKKREAR